MEYGPQQIEKETIASVGSLPSKLSRKSKQSHKGDFLTDLRKKGTAAVFGASFDKPKKPSKDNQPLW